MATATDLAERVSPALAQVARHVLDDPERDADATLDLFRTAVSRGLLEHLVQTAKLGPHEADEVAQELDELIGEFGPAIPLVHLLRYRASPTLSTVIQEVLARDDDPESPGTLRDVREAIDDGLLTELVGAGAIDSDDEQALPGELYTLIRMHGEEALAEELLSAEDDTS